MFFHCCFLEGEGGSKDPPSPGLPPSHKEVLLYYKKMPLLKHADVPGSNSLVIKVQPEFPAPICRLPGYPCTINNLYNCSEWPFSWQPNNQMTPEVCARHKCGQSFPSTQLVQHHARVESGEKQLLYVSQNYRTENLPASFPSWEST